MTWTAVSAFTDGQVVTHTIMNQLAANIDHLRSPNIYTAFAVAELTTTSTSFVSMGGAYEQAAFAMTGGPLLVLLTGMVRVTGSASEIGRFDIEVDGSRVGHSTGGLMAIQRETNAGSVTGTPPYAAVIGRIITGLSVGNHSIKMMWNVDSGGTLRIGHSGSAIRFYVKEL